MNNVAVTIGDDLKFHVVRIEDKFLKINLVISESFLRLVTRAMERRLKARLIVGRAHAAAASACDGLDHNRITDLLCNLDCIVLRFDDSITSRSDWHAGFPRKKAGSVLVPHSLHCPRRRPDEFNVAAFANLYEMRVLCEKPITGMNRVDVANLGCAHDAIDF